ncbi:FixJ family two-component response regulator [Sphingomonas zeicaulis]|uniref:response regulator transcription factor n=1 Tax=Sphingomonas zeicaulis TaxID=1632740 RepID=UPI003D1F3394
MSGSELVAVVDDDRSIRTALSSLLRSAGYDVALFETAEAFLEADVAGRPACLITDIQMPGMGGLALIERIAALWPDLPVIVITAFPEDALRRRALDAGAAAFLSKPFDANLLLATIERELAGDD